MGSKNIFFPKSVLENTSSFPRRGMAQVDTTNTNKRLNPALNTLQSYLFKNKKHVHEKPILAPGIEAAPRRLGVLFCGRHSYVDLAEYPVPT
jgi:hypothetical protein